MNILRLYWNFSFLIFHRSTSDLWAWSQTPFNIEWKKILFLLGRHISEHMLESHPLFMFKCWFFFFFYWIFVCFLSYNRMLIQATITKLFLCWSSPNGFLSLPLILLFQPVYRGRVIFVKQSDYPSPGFRFVIKAYRCYRIWSCCLPP